MASQPARLPNRTPRSPPRNDHSDPLKSSILAKSQLGWNAPTVVPPLKINKQQNKQSPDDNPAQSIPRHPAGAALQSGIPRRGSSSFNHVRNHSLVSNSPFRSVESGSGPIGAKYIPTPLSQSGGYKVLSVSPRPGKIPGATPRKPSPAFVANRRASPSTATRRTSLEKRKRIANENFRKVLEIEAAVLEGSTAVPPVVAPTQHKLGIPKRESKGLTKLQKAEYVTKSPFILGRQPSNSTSPSLASSTNTSPQTTATEEFEELGTPLVSDAHPQVEVDEPPVDVRLSPEIPRPSSPFSKPDHSLGVPLGSRPLPASPRSRVAASSFPSAAISQSPPSPPSTSTSFTPTPLPTTTPHKSSLKAKRRIRGPRSPESPETRLVERTSSGRKRFGSIRRRFERRKTVTFDERCDVLEFEPDEDEEHHDSEWVTSDDEDPYYDEENPYEEGVVQLPDEEELDEPRHGMSHTDTIDGLVNSILEDEMATFRQALDAAVDGDRSMDSHHTAGSDNPSLDFKEANTSLDFHEEDSFDAEMQANHPHFFSNPDMSIPIPEEDETEDHAEDAAKVEERILDQLESVSRDHSFQKQNLSSNSIVREEQASPSARESSSYLGDGLGPRFASPSTSLESRTSLLSRSDSNLSHSGRTSPRISKEDVQRRLWKQKAERNASNEALNFDGRDLSGGGGPPLSPSFSREGQSSSSRGDRALPPIPKSASSSSISAYDMTRQGQSHDAVLQFTRRQEGVDPPAADLRERSITTDGNLPPPAFPLQPGRQSLDYSQPGVDISDVKSALDRLMIGVENGFLDDRTEPPPGTPHSRSGSRPSSVLSVRAQQAPPVQHHPMEAIQSSRALRMSTSSQPSTPGKDDDIGNETFNSLNKSSELPWTRASPGRPERRRSDTAAEDVFLSTGLPSTDASHPPSRPNLTRVKSGKEVIKAHEAAIIAKRRELRQRNGSVKRPVKRRSLSTGDAEQVRKERKAALPDEAELLDVTVEAVDIPLTDSVDREIRKLFHEKQPSYLLREHEATIYATADKDKDKIAHVDRAGDVDSGKAWRRVQRPSDMNEYARQIKEFRESERPGKALGKVFVKVLAVKGINVPIPSQPTAFTITLNNGIHCVETPEARLAKDCRVDQEFELIEHGQLEFTLTIKVRKDPHILAMIQAAQPPPKQAPPPPPPPPMQKSSGLFARFSTPGKKSKTHKRAATQPEAVPRPPPAAPRSLEETIGHHLRSDGTLCQAFISFKDIAKRCDTRLFETSYPLAGHAMDVRGGSRVRSLTIPTRQVGEIVLQLFRLPPLHGVKPDQLPQSLEECHRGLRHVAWHKVTYHEGVLTQIGGDCSTWRRRHVKVIGSNLVSFNDVTNKPTATIELKMALAVVDDQDPASQSTVRRKKIREEGVYHVERSFRLLFPGDEEIAFFTDTDAEKARWLEILRALIGRIPPNPLWAELVWQRQEEKAAAWQTATSPVNERFPGRD